MLKKMIKLGVVAAAGYWVYNHPKEIMKLMEDGKKIYANYQRA